MRFLTFLVLYTGILFQGFKSIAQLSPECIRIFEDFAYRAPLTMNDLTGIVEPGNLWNPVSEIDPNNIEANFENILRSTIELVTNQNQIWLSVNSYTSQSGMTSNFVVFEPESETWTYVDSSVQGTDYFVSKVFQTSDNRIWGFIDNAVYGSYEVDLPLLSKFNEESQQFEIAQFDTDDNMPASIRTTYTPEILLDDKDIIWIFASYDGIYKYNLKNLTASKVIELDIFFAGVASGSSNIIYFDNFIAFGTDDVLYRFSSSSNQISELKIPTDTWPPYYGLLVDSSNRLWLGSTGYRNPDGTWHLIHPDPSLPNENIGNFAWDPPELLMQDSSGRLWYRKYLGSGGQFEGTAWYDPETGEGCLITNWPSHVIEDDEQNLWILVEDTLYRRPVTDE